MTHKTHKKENNSIGGIILILIGIFALGSQFIDIPNWGTFIVAGLGAIFLVWGILTRNDGLIIPGGILSGIGWGIVVIESNLFANLENEGGIFLVVFALGWFSIPLLSGIFTDETHWWALIPGGIIGAVGLAVSFGGVFLNVLELAGQLWPLILIAVGVSILVKAVRPKEKSPEDLDIVVDLEEKTP